MITKEITVCTEIFTLCNIRKFRKSVGIHENFILRKLVKTEAASWVPES